MKFFIAERRGRSGLIVIMAILYDGRQGPGSIGRDVMGNSGRIPD
jgi:hypothetical protein